MGGKKSAWNQVFGDAADLFGTKRKEEEMQKIEHEQKAEQRAARQAQLEKEQLAKDRIKQEAANEAATGNSTVVLGSRRKKRKGSAVSNGMGLSKGNTGMQ